jgi:hypothetical protein
MRYAVLRNNVVQSIVEWDGVTVWSPPPGCTVRLALPGDVPPPPEDAAAQAVTQSMEAGIDAALAGLRLTANSTGTLSSAQLSNAVRAIARCTIRLGKLSLRQTDSDT